MARNDTGSNKKLIFVPQLIQGLEKVLIFDDFFGNFHIILNWVEWLVKKLNFFVNFVDFFLRELLDSILEAQILAFVDTFNFSPNDPVILQNHPNGLVQNVIFELLDRFWLVFDGIELFWSLGDVGWPGFLSFHGILRIFEGFSLVLFCLLSSLQNLLFLLIIGTWIGQKSLIFPQILRFLRCFLNNLRGILILLLLRIFNFFCIHLFLKYLKNFIKIWNLKIFEIFQNFKFSNFRKIIIITWRGKYNKPS